MESKFLKSLMALLIGPVANGFLVLNAAGHWQFWESLSRLQTVRSQISLRAAARRRNRLCLNFTCNSVLCTCQPIRWGVNFILMPLADLSCKSSPVETFLYSVMSTFCADGDVKEGSAKQSEV